MFSVHRQRSCAEVLVHGSMQAPQNVADVGESHWKTQVGQVATDGLEASELTQEPA